MNQKFAGVVFLNKIQGHAIEVPFNGAAPTVFAVASDSLEFAFVNYTDTKEFAKSGRVRIIGIASKQRRNDVLNVKTFAEQSIEFEQEAWFTLAAPKGMDKNTIMRLNAVVTDALKKDKISDVATEMIPMHSSVAGAKIFIDTQYKTYRPLIEKVKALSANN
jgi:tripartite-type tricarboxylate transporter receptor subunit TctC